MKVKKQLQIPAISIPLWWPDLPGDWRDWLPSRGNVLFTLVMIAVLLWAQSAGAVPFRAESAASTGTIAYQGRLADSSGNPLTSTLNMSFRLYNASTGGAPLWTEQWTGSNGVKVSDGLFNVMLGSLTPIAQNVITGNSTLFLGITVGTDDEMAPRVQLGSVPFAVQALTVPDGSITTAKIADGAIMQKQLGDDIHFSTVTTFKASVPIAAISDTIGVLVSRQITVTESSDILIAVGNRATKTEVGNEFGFFVYRDGADITSTIHTQSGRSGHLYFHYMTIDTGVAPGTYTYSLRAVVVSGPGTQFLHNPEISLVVIPKR